MQSQAQPSPRYAVNMLMRAPNGALALGCTRNLSMSGVFLETTSRPPLQSTHLVLFVWGDESFECDVRVVRHAADGIGLQFLAVEHNVRFALADIIATTTPSR